MGCLNELYVQIHYDVISCTMHIFFAFSFESEMKVYLRNPLLSIEYMMILVNKRSDTSQ